MGQLGQMADAVVGQPRDRQVELLKMFECGELFERLIVKRDGVQADTSQRSEFGQ